MATLSCDEELTPTGLEPPIHETLGPCSSLLQEYHEIEHAWKVANWAYMLRSTFGASKAKRKLIKKQSAGILYLALYLIWSISSDKSDELQKLMEDSAVFEHTSSSNAELSPQVRLLRQDDATDHCVQPRQMQHDGETTATQDSQSSRHLLTRKCISLDRALVEAARRMEWIRLYEPDFMYARRSYEQPHMLYMVYDTCRKAMEYIHKDEARSGKFVLKYRVADLEAIKDWWALLQLGRREFNDFQGTEGKIAKGTDECNVQMATLQERIDRAKAFKV